MGFGFGFGLGLGLGLGLRLAHLLHLDREHVTGVAEEVRDDEGDVQQDGLLRVRVRVRVSVWG